MSDPIVATVAAGVAVVVAGALLWRLRGPTRAPHTTSPSSPSGAPRWGSQAPEGAGEALSLLAATVEATTEGILAVSLDGRVLHYNRRFVEIWNIPDDVLASRLRQPLLDHALDQVADPDAFLARVRELDQNPTSGSRDVLRLKDGRMLERHILPQRVSGKVLGKVITFRDITEHRRAEETLRALSRRLVKIQEQERARIARELHDRIGQSLTAIKLSLQVLQRRNLPAALAAPVSEGLTLVEHTIQDVRTLSFDLRPSMLDDLGLAAAAGAYARRQADLAGLDLELDISALDRSASKAVETACFRVLQEAVTNVARHAEATTLRVALKLSDGDLELTVTDDGRGFDASLLDQASAEERHLGLLGMRERTELAGGGLFIYSAPARGTVVCARFPMRGHRSGSAA